MHNWLARALRSKRWRRSVFPIAVAVIAMVAASCGSSSHSNANGTSGKSSGSSGKHFKIALSLSYSGNDWQNEAANLVKAAAATPPYNTEVTLHEDIAGASVTQQIQTLDNEIAAGYNAIIVYPISPTALNSTIQKACAAGIVVAAYDSLVTAPCAYNVHIDQYQWGIVSATWLANALHGHGSIADITGVAGTTVDTDRQIALNNVLKKYPGITIAGKANGEWAQPQGKAAFASIYSAHPDISGIYAEAACYSITQYLISLSKAPLPCAGEFSNGHRQYMLPKSMGGIDLQSSSSGSPAYSGELALIDAVKTLQGQHVPKNIILPLPHDTTADLAAAGPKALGTNPAQGAVVYPSSLVSNPGFFDDLWSPLVMEGVQGGLTGQADPISTPKPCSQVPGCIGNNGLQARASLHDWN